LAIGTLINEAASIFIENEEAILEGNYPHSLLDKCNYEAQINDIIKLSVEKIYKSNQVIEKEILGYKVIATLLSEFIDALNAQEKGQVSNYQKLVINLLPENFKSPKEKLYNRVLSVCNYVASLTDGYALQLYKKFNN